MAGVSWLVDKKTIATRIKYASTETAEVHFESNPCISCPNCQHVIDNNNLKQQFPGLPRGVKFDPSDQDIMSHLLAKVGVGDSEPHPFIDEFITTIEEDGGICYTHPQHLPGVSQDGSVAHFFHKAIKAYNSGGRKRRRLFVQDFGDLRWHKTGKTRPIFVDGIQRGCKKIMVLYMTPTDGGNAEKTNWVVHQYHIGREEDEKEGEYVISKIFYQQQVKLGKKNDQDVPETSEASIARVVDPVTPNFVTPELHCNKKQCSDMNQEQESQQEPQHISQILPNITHRWLLDSQGDHGECSHMNQEQESHHMNQEQEFHHMNQEQEPQHFSQILPNLQWLLDSQDDYEELPNIDLSMVESQNIEGIDDVDLSLTLFSSQQFAEESPLLFDYLQNQSPKRNVELDKQQMEQPSLSGFAHLGAEEQSKKDSGECQNPHLDTTKNNVGDCQNSDRGTGNVELNPQSSDLHLSQLDFSSQDSYIAWGGSISKIFK
ncbi:hypothetical protein P8452_09830 [Trifolium repens]|nr:hypothetical protein P8452_09830 [Trifolium repens]